MQSIIDTITLPDWEIQGWTIQFLLSERQLHEIRNSSKINNWYEDTALADTWISRVGVCFNSIQQFHVTFGSLPQIGDRLFNEDIGMRVQDRSIDGGMKTITFTLTI